MKKYPIKKEFYPFAYFSTPASLSVIKMIRPLMKVIGGVPKDSAVETELFRVPGYRNGTVEIVMFTPKGISTPAPCLVNYHGGGFMFEPYTTHYKLALEYAKEAKCKVAFVNYRLVLDFPMPCPQYDSFEAYKWICAYSAELGIDPDRIGISGDSAGGTLAAVTCMLARDEGLMMPKFQMLLYPSLDTTYDSDSCKRFPDTPVWNSTDAVRMRPLVNPNPESMPEFLYSPLKAEDFSCLPLAYIEIAEFDCLHDDGINYARKLKAVGIRSYLKEIPGTMHSYDMTLQAPTTRRVMHRRIRFLRRMFRTEE